MKAGMRILLAGMLVAVAHAEISTCNKKKGKVGCEKASGCEWDGKGAVGMRCSEVSSSSDSGACADDIWEQCGKFKGKKCKMSNTCEWDQAGRLCKPQPPCDQNDSSDDAGGGIDMDALRDMVAQVLEDKFPDMMKEFMKTYRIPLSLEDYSCPSGRWIAGDSDSEHGEMGIGMVNSPQECIEKALEVCPRAAGATVESEVEWEMADCYCEYGEYSPYVDSSYAYCDLENYCSCSDDCRMQDHVRGCRCGKDAMGDDECKINYCDPPFEPSSDGSECIDPFPNCVDNVDWVDVWGNGCDNYMGRNNCGDFRSDVGNEWQPDNTIPEYWKADIRRNCPKACGWCGIGDDIPCEDDLSWTVEVSNRDGTEVVGCDHWNDGSTECGNRYEEPSGYFSVEQGFEIREKCPFSCGICRGPAPAQPECIDADASNNCTSVQLSLFCDHFSSDGAACDAQMYCMYGPSDPVAWSVPSERRKALCGPDFGGDALGVLYPCDNARCTSYGRYGNGDNCCVLLDGVMNNKGEKVEPMTCSDNFIPKDLNRGCLGYELDEAKGYTCCPPPGWTPKPTMHPKPKPSNKPTAEPEDNPPAPTVAPTYWYPSSLPAKYPSSLPTKEPNMEPNMSPTWPGMSPTVMSPTVGGQLQLCHIMKFKACKAAQDCKWMAPQNAVAGACVARPP